MDILIKNMKLPKGDIPLVLMIASDGTVEEIDDSDEINKTDAKAIELPPHGTLKDTDAFLAEYAPKTTTIHVVIDEKTLSIEYPLKEILRPLFDAPTVLEASK